MAVYNASGNVLNLDGFYNYAKGEILSKRYSSYYKRMPFLAYIASKGKSESETGRPSANNILGAGDISSIDMAMAGGTQITQRIQTGQVGGGKWMGLRDTNPSTGNDSQDQHNASATWRWAQYKQPIKLWKSTLDAAKGDKYKIADAIRESTAEAMEEVFAVMNLAYLRGNPTDQTADRWDTTLGVLQALDTDNTYANLNRSTYASWAGLRVTTATTAALSIIDDANITQGAQDKGPGIDFVLCSRAIYLKLKAEALARGQEISVMDMPDNAKVGIKTECIKYGNVTITYDPNFTGNWSSYDSDVTDATKLFIGFTSQDWTCYYHPDYNFKLTPFYDEGERAGGDDAITARVEVQTILRCAKPWNSIVYTNVV